MLIILRGLLQREIRGEDLAVLLMLVNRNMKIDMTFSRENKSTNLVPFMSAATSSGCGLHVVYVLAMRNLDKFLKD